MKTMKRCHAEVKRVYDAVISGKLTEEEMLEEVVGLYKRGYRETLKGREAILWGDMLEERHTMPFDVHCELVGRPTHLAVAAFMHAWVCSPKCRECLAINEALRLGMEAAKFCTFHGQGYEAREVWLENMKIYEDAGAYEFVTKYGDLNERFTERFVNEWSYYRGEENE